MLLKRLWRDRRGQAALESILILMVFLATLIGILDFGQLLFIHQSLVERVRSSVRWGIVNPYDGTGTQITNMVLYNTPTSPADGTPTFLGLTLNNVSIIYTPPTALNPDDERITVSIVNYPYKFLSPWIAGSFTNNNAIIESAAMIYKP